MQQPTRPQKPEQQASAAQFYTQLVQLPATVTQQAYRDVLQLQHEQASASPALHQQPDHSQPQQQQRGLGGNSSRPLQQRAQAAGQQQMPFAPVKFSSRTHLLDPNTGTMTLPPKSASADADAPAATAAATAASGSDTAPRHRQRHKQQHQQHVQQQQQQQPLGIQPMHPVVAAHTASSKRPIDRSNLGYKLLSKAGWQEGQGLGANEQGMAAPLAVSYHKGNTGLGFSKQQQPQQLQAPAAASGAAAGSSIASQEAAAAAAGAVAGPVLGGKRVAALVAAELAAEDLDTKVKRYRQLREQKAKEDRDKAIQTYLYRAFNDVEAPDSNPLLAKSHRLTATNPLLD